VVLSENSSFSGMEDGGTADNTFCTDNTCQMVKISATSYEVGTDIKLEEGKTYYWKVRDTASVSWSSAFRFTVEEDIPPSDCTAHFAFVDDGNQPDEVAPGTDLDLTWEIKNISECDAVGYHLGFRSAAPDSANADYGGTDHPSFTIRAGDSGFVEANIRNTPEEEGEYRVEFDIYTHVDELLPSSSGGLTLFSEFAVTDDKPEPWDCPEREPLYDNWEEPASGLGPDFTHTWGLVNNTSCSMNNFTIGNPEVYLWTGGTSYVPYSASVSGTYTKFSLAANGGKDKVTANFNFELPAEGIYRIFFDIITENGDVLPYLPDSTAPGHGRLFTDVGRSIGGCFAPAPAINSVDHVDLGNGKVAVSAEVENVSEDPSLMTNDNKSTLESGSNGNYNGGDDADKADSTNKIEVVGECDQDAFLEYFYHTTRSDLFGKNCKANACGGSVEFIGDPVNTATGNFIQQETDAAVAGPGDSTIRLQRTYNSQA
ncbi:MAG: hypothetical protein D3923_15620, partial [Candidatus Electrothrix sp. AR3]|nr:hypothetical protein [Candidatus Electrothrix sp. AR3]